MSSFTPPLSGENLHTVAAIAQHTRCSREAICSFIHDRRITAVQVARRYLIAESEAERLAAALDVNQR